MMKSLFWEHPQDAVPYGIHSAVIRPVHIASDRFDGSTRRLTPGTNKQEIAFQRLGNMSVESKTGMEASDAQRRSPGTRGITRRTRTSCMKSDFVRLRVE
jgi:hypothetical protein